MAFLMLTMMSIMMPRAGVAAERIDEVVGTKSTITDPKEPVAMEQCEGVIAFHHVNFRYPGATEDVLSDIDFVAEPGKTTAIIGSTGCGKSTLVNLLPRFYDVTGGEITLDGTDIRKLSQKQLRDSIGYVPQSPSFDLGDPVSVLDLFVTAISRWPVFLPTPAKLRSKVLECLKRVNAETLIDKRVGALSGGEVQRVLLAMAMEPLPNILILDEPMSGVDEAGVSCWICWTKSAPTTICPFCSPPTTSAP